MNGFKRKKAFLANRQIELYAIVIPFVRPYVRLWQVCELWQDVSSDRDKFEQRPAPVGLPEWDLGSIQHSRSQYD